MLKYSTPMRGITSEEVEIVRLMDKKYLEDDAVFFGALSREKTRRRRATQEFRDLVCQLPENDQRLYRNVDPYAPEDQLFWRQEREKADPFYSR